MNRRLRPMFVFGFALLIATAALAAETSDAIPPARWGSHLFAATRLDESGPAVPDASNSKQPKPAKPPSHCKDPTVRASSGRCFVPMLGQDIAGVFTAPARWKAKQWGLFSAGVVGVGVVMIFDEAINTSVLHSSTPFNQDVAKVFEPFGTWGSFVVLGGFYVGGLAAHDEKARGVFYDGLAASFIASIMITPTIKYVTGRSRPNAEMGSSDFHPFNGGASFPSGHVTQAFAVASVVATEYKRPWVQFVCYGTASLVGYARMLHGAHWASDVVAGALIGTGVGQAVARLNLPPRLAARHVRVTPMIGPGAQGIMIAASF